MKAKLQIVIATLIALIASGMIANAEIPIKTQRALQDQAPEKLQIEILNVQKKRKLGGQFEFNIDAKVISVRKSATGLKVGDKLKLRYQLHDPKKPIPSRSYSIELEKGERYNAYLGPASGADRALADKEGKIYFPRAAIGSFGPILEEAVSLDDSLKWITSIERVAGNDIKGTEAKYRQFPVMTLKEWAQKKKLDLSYQTRIDNAGGYSRSYQLKDGDLRYMVPLQALVELKLLGQAKLTDAGLKHLAKVTTLKKLYISGSDVSGNGLSSFKKDQLQTLVISSSAVSDAQLRTIGELSSLTELDLSGNHKITDAGLKHLYGLKSLKTLRVYGSYSASKQWRVQVTKAGIEAIQEALPNCKIISDFK